MTRIVGPIVFISKNKLDGQNLMDEKGISKFSIFPNFTFYPSKICIHK